MLLLAQGIKRGDRSDPAMVLQASIDLGEEGVAELRIGGELEASVGAFAFQAPFEDGIERDVPGTPLLIDDGPDFDSPCIGGERALLIADLGRETEAHRPMPTLWGTNTRADMVPHPLPASL